MSSLLTRQEALDHLIELTRANGGGTFNAYNLSPVQPRSGYAVSLKGGTVTSPDAPIALIDFIGHDYIGTWIDNGKLYIDPVTIVPTLREAIDLSIENDQIAFYSFAENVAINVADVVVGTVPVLADAREEAI